MSLNFFDMNTKSCGCCTNISPVESDKGESCQSNNIPTANSDDSLINNGRRRPSFFSGIFFNQLKQVLKKKLRVAALVLGLGSLVLVAGAFGTRNFELVKSLDIFASVLRELNANYVEEFDPMTLVQTAIDGMLESLDPYTVFVPEAQLDEMQFMTTGQYGGIGALITQRNNQILVSEPYEGTPAYEAGLRAGDIILEVDGVPLLNMTADMVSERLKGQPGSPVILTIRRYNEPNPLQISITRRMITISNVAYFGVIDNNIGYILLTGFTQNAGREVRNAINNLRQNNNLSGIIVDMRGNGGGLMNEAVDIVNHFVERNTLIVSTKGNAAQRVISHRTLNEPIDTQLPLAILINRGSASASEIVAGAIQDLDRGVVIGQRSFGKGLVQNVVPLSYNTQLKLTVAKYYIPSGRSIQAVDYATRNEDGSVAAIPDSLKRRFETRNGRIVYDGGGILPDIITDATNLSDISRALIINFLIFDFATRFHAHNAEIGSPYQFRITDAIYNDFISFLADKEYNYVTDSERLLQEFRNAAISERYFASVEQEFNVLKASILDNKKDDLKIFREEISFLLKEEILSRYFLQRGRAQANLSTDPEIRTAIDLLSSREKYRNTLSGR